MSAVNQAVIDVGTNSVKLLIARIECSEVYPLWESSEQTRLGTGLYESGRLQPARIEETARVIAAFVEHARKFEPAQLLIIGTSACREAANASDLVEAVRSLTGLPLQIIPGDKEADLAFRGVCAPSLAAGQGVLAIDIGGGSTELIFGRSGRRQWGGSFSLGTVRMLERLPLADPPTGAQRQECETWVREFVRREVAAKLAEVLPAEERPSTLLLGTGGSFSILARMHGKLETWDREQIEGMVLSLDDVTRHLDLVWSLPMAARREIPGLPSNRADVILFGLLILGIWMKELELSTLRISTRGLRYAALCDAELLVYARSH